MKEWIASCQTTCVSHCEPHSKWAPTRLLDLSGSDIRLVESPDANTEYAAFSYAWTDDEDVSCLTKAEQSNLDVLKEAIDVACLDRTFVDAITTSRSLGIRHLWIDRLCIVQDSPEDRFKEEALLYKIFHHAKVTLVATGVSSPDSGFLLRDISQTPAAKLAYSPTSTLIVSPSRHVSEDQTPRSLAVESSKWTSSARNLIQRTHSTRLIYFPPPSSSPDILFECRWSLRSETVGSESILGRESPLWARPGDDVTERNEEVKERMRAYTYLTYQNLLTAFTTKNISNPKDRLLLMSNPASAGQGTIADAYIPRAGLFGRNIPASLMWFATPSSSRSRVPSAPSWSWASINAPIDFQSGLTDYELPKSIRKQKFAFQTMSLSGDTSLPSPGTELEPLQLSVKSFLKQLKCLKIQNDADPDQIQMRTEYPYDLIVEHGSTADEAEDMVFAHGDLDLSNADGIIESAREFAYLHVCTEMYPTGLILVRERAEGEGAMDVYRRVGVADIAGSMGGVLIDPPFLAGEHKTVCLI
ncbi:hypothetical protein jhhlp_007840 [Lomentospora prolificans]|uniref:Heterokaryon incompatibility domain-containing protein n=1 Tax=Lomentospora prolificans TaxID=41688 RepID=A0A2N3N0Q1_9PEZI|nr:hypothetical protein jhhlp_007840 [Lomentospora prolificans]